MHTQPCSGCGDPVIYELYTIDALSYYEKGVIVRHQCQVAAPAPLNERDFCPKCFQVLAWGCECSAEPEPKPKPTPPKKRGGFTGGVQL